MNIPQRGPISVCSQPTSIHDPMAVRPPKIRRSPHTSRSCCLIAVAHEGQIGVRETPTLLISQIDRSVERAL